MIDSSDRGGIARYTAALVDDLLAADVDVALAAPAGRERGGGAVSHIPWGTEIAGWPAWRQKGMLAWELPRRAINLLGIVRSARPRLVHLQNNVGGPFDPLLMWWWRHRGLRLVRTVHDVVAHWESGSARRDRRTWRLADVVIVHGTDAKAVIEEDAPGIDVRVIPPDLPRMTAPSRASARTALGLDDRPRALVLGIISAYKGIDLLATAWPSVRERVPDACLDVVGSLPVPLEELDRLASLDGVNVHLGWLSDDDMLLWAATPDFCLLPYAHGVHSAIMHNAVVAGTSVLASPSLAEETARFGSGRTVELEPAAWADAMVEALTVRPLPPPSERTRGAQAAATAAVYSELLSR